jgi:hypothetical protein
MASCVATAYIMRYGRLNAGVGPPEVPFSESAGFGDGAVMLGDGDGALVGGSIEECEVGGLEGITGSGNDGMSSSCDVSMVICLVGGAVCRIV